MDSSLKDLLTFLFQRAEAMQTFWNFYAGAVTILIGVVTAGKAQWLTRSACAGLTLAFAVFAVGNFMSLDAVRRQREALVIVALKHVDDKLKPAPVPTNPPEPTGNDRPLHNLLTTVEPPALWQLALFHGALDAVTIGGIWSIPLARRRQERARRPTA